VNYGTSENDKVNFKRVVAREPVSRGTRAPVPFSREGMLVMVNEAKYSAPERAIGRASLSGPEPARLRLMPDTRSMVTTQPNMSRTPLGECSKKHLSRGFFCVR